MKFYKILIQIYVKFSRTDLEFYEVCEIRLGFFMIFHDFGVQAIV